MPEYGRIDISEVIDVNKTNASKKIDICHYWYFKDIGFKHEPYLCICCHDLIQKAMRFNDVIIVYIKGSAYRVHFWYISKEDAISIMNILIWLIKRCFVYFLLIYKKWMSLLKKRIIKKTKCYTKKSKRLLWKW